MKCCACEWRRTSVARSATLGRAEPVRKSFDVDFANTAGAPSRKDAAAAEAATRVTNWRRVHASGGCPGVWEIEVGFMVLNNSSRLASDTFCVTPAQVGRVGPHAPFEAWRRHGGAHGVTRPTIQRQRNQFGECIQRFH